MSKSNDPLRRLPTPAQVHAHIGRLYRELRLARRLYKLSQAAANAAHAAQGTEGVARA
jgi:hypothetical protein